MKRGTTCSEGLRSVPESATLIDPPGRKDAKAAVEVRNISKTYLPSPPLMRVLLRSSILSPIVALNDVSLEVEFGTIQTIVGPNGAGKSTLFRILTGLTTATSGSASVCGFDVTNQSFRVRRLIGFHPADERTLLGRHSCEENLLFHGRLQGIPAGELRSRITDALELVGLRRHAKSLALSLSSGMKARLQLARALLHRPRVLILDEPTGALDPIAAYQLLEIIKQATSTHGIATLFSSHRLEEIEALPERVLLLNEGRVVYNGNLETLRGRYQEPRLELRFSSADEAKTAAPSLGSVRGVEIVSAQGEMLVLRTAVPMGELFRAADGALNGLVSIGKVRVPLRDFLAQLLSPDQPTV